MPLVNIILLVSTAILLSIGQILFKITANQISSAGSLTFMTLLNPTLIVALAIYGIATIMWVLSLRGVPLRQAYPFSGIAFIIVPIISHFILAEQLRFNTLLGGALILIGITVSAYQ